MLSIAKLVLLIPRLFIKLMRLQELPRAAIDLIGAVIIPMRVSLYLCKLRLKASVVEGIARRPDQRQWE